jgi:hypothetical protein
VAHLSAFQIDPGVGKRVAKRGPGDQEHRL